MTNNEIEKTSFLRKRGIQEKGVNYSQSFKKRVLPPRLLNLEERWALKARVEDEFSRRFISRIRVFPYDNGLVGILGHDIAKYQLSPDQLFGLGELIERGKDTSVLTEL